MKVDYEGNPIQDKPDEIIISEDVWLEKGVNSLLTLYMGDEFYLDKETTIKLSKALQTAIDLGFFEEEESE